MFFVYATICILVITLSNAAPQNRDAAQHPTLEQVLNSLLRLLKFFNKRYKLVNIDGIFGVRMAQNEMIRALTKINSGENPAVSPQVKSQLEEIRDLADELCERALPEVKKQDERYFAKFSSLIQKPWKIHEFEPQRLKKMGKDFLPNRTLTESEGDDDFSEEVSDECMLSLLGDKGKKCDVDKCWNQMTKRGTILYYTTHQILYFLLGFQSSCQSDMEHKAAEMGGLEKIFQGLCYNIIYQMETLFRRGTVVRSFQDIFLESGAVCGVSGFVDALNIVWLKEVMTWQDKKLGCFKNGYEDNMDEYQARFMENLDRHQNEWRKRNLLSDADMGDSCSSHKSGVAAGYLAVHIRLFLDKDVNNRPQFQHADMLVNNGSSEKYYPFSKIFYGCVILLGLGICISQIRHRLKIFSAFCRR